jgi:hypothetical protein
MAPPNPVCNALAPWPAATVLGLALALTGLAGCGGGDNASSKTTTSRPATVQREADPLVVNRIPLYATIDQVVARVGRPARIERRRARVPKSKTSAAKVVIETCYIYGVKGGRPADRIRMCFVGGKLASVLVLRAKPPGSAPTTLRPSTTPPEPR